jgi:hypothetical protein
MIAGLSVCIGAGVLLLLLLGSFIMRHPKHQCGYCGEVYKGRHALELVDSCKSQHLMEIHGKL